MWDSPAFHTVREIVHQREASDQCTLKHALVLQMTQWENEKSPCTSKAQKPQAIPYTDQLCHMQQRAEALLWALTLDWSWLKQPLLSWHVYYEMLPGSLKPDVSQLTLKLTDYLCEVLNLQPIKQLARMHAWAWCTLHLNQGPKSLRNNSHKGWTCKNNMHVHRFCPQVVAVAAMVTPLNYLQQYHTAVWSHLPYDRKTLTLSHIAERCHVKVHTVTQCKRKMPVLIKGYVQHQKQVQDFVNVKT